MYEKGIDTYAQQQYFLTTGNDPFVSEARNEIPITYPKEVDLIDDDTYEYLVVMDKNTVETHSLNEFSEW